MSTQHTPGPWFKNRGFLIGSDGSDVVAADLGVGLGADNGDGIRKANARLIAAAPDLLFELKKCASLLKTAFGETNDLTGKAVIAQRLESVTALIAKATGETK